MELIMIVLVTIYFRFLNNFKMNAAVIKLCLEQRQRNNSPLFPASKTNGASSLHDFNAVIMLGILFSPFICY